MYFRFNRCNRPIKIETRYSPFRRSRNALSLSMTFLIIFSFIYHVACIALYHFQKNVVEFRVKFRDGSKVTPLRRTAFKFVE